MKLQELLANIHNKNFNLEKSLQVKKYLPMELKKTIAQAIIYECTNEEDGVIKVDSVARYLSYVRYMITAHTNLEYTDEDYDALCSTEYGETTLLNTVINYFGSDAKECSRILDFVMDDYLRETNLESSVIKLLHKLNYEITDLLRLFNKKIEDIDLSSIISEDIDVERLNDFLKTYIK